MFHNSKILITGGTGSFGGELVKMLINTEHNFSFNEIRILSRDKGRQERFKADISSTGGVKNFSTQIKLFCGDITQDHIVDKAVSGCDYIIHAAALKDVTYCEQHPLEALQVNVYGTDNVIKSAIKHKVKKVIIISTDKAVAPAGTMGITKAMMERLVLSKTITKADASSTSLIIIRFGNLIGSSGTVVPLFIQQVKEGEKLTVTNPQMTRFMMTLDQAAEYALFALENGNNGEIIIRNSPALSIGNLAKAVIELYGGDTSNGSISDSDNSTGIIVTGTRPGERLYEIMASEQEMLKAEQIGNSIYLRIPDVIRDSVAESKKLSQAKELNSGNIGELSIEGIKQMIKNSLNNY